MPKPADDATHDEVVLLTQADLPDGWHLPDQNSSRWQLSDNSAEIDEAINYDDQPTFDDPSREPNDDLIFADTSDGRWRLITHNETGARVLLRPQRQAFVAPPEVRITGVMFLPNAPGLPVTSQLTRDLPIARIEANINKRLFNMKRVGAVRGDSIKLPSGHKVRVSELMKPITAGPKQNPDFYALVALQHNRLGNDGDQNPSATIAEINGVPHSTARGWVAKARSLGLLPRGRRSIAG